MRWLVCGLMLATLGAQAAESPTLGRQSALVRMVRQDCGSCHGMKLTGGLGPALTREALADIPLLTLKATIYHGRPGTPMPPWRSMISESEAEWIASKLLQGFPSETPSKDKP
ncbi:MULTISPECIES: c-type cytochrome [Roseateles]